MAHAPEKRTQVRSAYVFDGISLDAIALRVGVSDRTVTRWKRESLAKGDDWDRARAATCLAGEGAEAVSRAVLEDFLKLFQSSMEALKADSQITALSKAEALSRLSDAFVKVSKGIGRTAPELSRLAIASEVLQLLVKFVKTKHPKHQEALLEVLEPFGEELSVVYG